MLHAQDCAGGFELCFDKSCQANKVKDPPKNNCNRNMIHSGEMTVGVSSYHSHPFALGG